WPNRVHLPGRPTLAHRNASAFATRIRNDRPSRPSTGGAGFSRSTLGVDLFIPRREIFPEMANTFALSCYGRLRRTAFSRGSDYRASPRRFAEAWSRLFRATTRIASAYCASCAARTQALAFRHPGHRWNGRQQVEPWETPRSFDRAQSLPSENISGKTNRDCATGQQRRGRCQSRGGTGRHSSGGINFHGL